MFIVMPMYSSISFQTRSLLIAVPSFFAPTSSSSSIHEWRPSRCAISAFCFCRSSITIHVLSTEGVLPPVVALSDVSLLSFASKAR